MSGSTRREILGALIGSPVAAKLLSCRPRAAEIAFDGAYVDRGLEEGHRLRDGFRVDGAEMVESEHVRVLILGAGIAGLTAGWQLGRGGVSGFRIVELAASPGGTSVGGRSDVTGYPWGAHYLPAPTRDHRDLLELLSETGTLIGTDAQGDPLYEETALCAAPKERVFHGGMWHQGLFPASAASTRDLEELARFEREVEGWVAYRDVSGRRAFSLPMALSSDGPDLRRLDAMSMSEWLDAKDLRSPMVRWYVEYACRDDFGASLADTSAWYALHYFAARIDRPGDESAELLTWPEGNAFLVDHLARRVGRERLLLENVVLSVAPESGGRRARVVTWSLRERRARAVIAERVIFALPSFLRSRVLADFPGVPPYDPAYAPWLVANVHLDGLPDYNGFATAWDNVIHGSRSLGYVVATHQRPRGRSAPTDPTVWTYYLPLIGSDARADRRALSSLSWKDAADAIVQELSSCHLGFRERVKRIDIMRWGHGMVRPTPGLAFSRERAAALRPVGPVHFAHSDLSGVALFEEAFFHGTRAAREVISALG